MYRGGDMLGRANAGYNLLIGNPTYISYLLFMTTTSCVAIGGGVWKVHLSPSPALHAEPLSVDGGIV